jgi:hypothetical protein
MLKNALFIILLFPLFLKAQTDSASYHPNFLFLSVNSDLLDTRDSKQSPIIYYGLGGGFDFGYYREGRKFIQEVRISNRIGTAINANSNMNTNYLVYFGQLNYGLLKNTTKKIAHIFPFNWGFYSHNQVLVRYQNGFSNNALSYDVILGLDAAIRINKDFKFFKKDLEWIAGYKIGIFQYYIRPAYSYPAPEGFTVASKNIFQSITKSFDFSFLTGLPSADFESRIRRIMHNGNQWDIFYQWQFHKIKTDETRFAAFHSLGVALYFNL